MPDIDTAQAKPTTTPDWSRSTRWQLLLAAISPLWALPLGEWISWHNSFLHHVGLCLSFVETYVIIGAVAALPVSLVGLFLARHRRNSLWLLPCSVLAVVCFSFGLHLSQPIKRQALEQVMHRAEPLIAAIRKFEAEQGKLSSDLFALIPGHLATLPTPGIGTSPEFSYLLSGKRKDMGDNPWMLEVRPPVAGIGFDVFIYLPNQNYPKRGWGGVLERIGTWAYVHE